MAFFTENCNVTHRLASDGRRQTIRGCQSNLEMRAPSEYAMMRDADDDDGGNKSSASDEQPDVVFAPRDMGDGGMIRTYGTETTSSVDSMSAAFKKIRYLNPATYIHPEHESFVDSESARLLQAEDDANPDAFISIPTLNLNQEAWSSNDLTYTHRKGDEKNSKELIRKTEAFKEWLSAKIEKENYTKLCKIEADEQLRMARAQDDRLRQAAREQNLRDWVQRKNKEAAEREEQLRLQQQDEVPKPTDPNESMRNYNAWLEKKLSYEQAVRTRKRLEAETRAELEEMRRQQAAKQFEVWLATAPGRPKPVPMNKGIYSLKGTISSLYVNPEPWVFDDDRAHHGGDGDVL